MNPSDYSPQGQEQQRATSAVSYDAGLRSHMQRVYNRMTLGVLVTAITAFFVSTSPELLKFFFSGPQMYLVMFAPVVVLMVGFNPMTMPSSKLKLSFLAISILYGISFSVIFIAFTGEDITRAFFLATAMFAGLSIFGYTTKKNLGALGTFSAMAIMGVFVLSIASMFIKSAMLFDLVSIIGILAFSGLTAWQTQSMKEMYNPANGDEANSRMAWSAALNLYISFIAIFQYILHFTSQR